MSRILNLFANLSNMLGNADISNQVNVTIKFKTLAEMSKFKAALLQELDSQITFVDSLRYRSGFKLHGIKVSLEHAEREISS